MLLDGVRDAVVEKLPADVAVVRLSRPSSSLSRSLENEDEEVAITRELFLKVNSSNERYEVPSTEYFRVLGTQRKRQLWRD